jgi:diacylglycerol kinase (ATP)
MADAMTIEKYPTRPQGKSQTGTLTFRRVKWFNNMKKVNTALLIINPKSRMGGDADLCAGIEQLEQAGIELIQTESSSAESVAQLIDVHQSDIDLVIIGGGDGTISAAAPALFRHKLPFAILPLGTANDLAHSLGMSKDLPDAFQNILANRRHKINLGMINDRFFFNAANIGLGVKVTRELTPELKKTWGVLSYLQAVLRAIRDNRSFKARLEIDGVPRRLRSIQIAVGNGRYYGGGNLIDERSTIGDGLLYLYSLPPLGILELLSLGPLLRWGKQRQARNTYNVSGRQIKISTWPSREIHADGEPAGKTPALFTVIPHALEVICPGPEQAETTSKSRFSTDLSTDLFEETT